MEGLAVFTFWIIVLHNKYTSGWCLAVEKKGPKTEDDYSIK